jgi:hypothetical protein
MNGLLFGCSGHQRQQQSLPSLGVHSEFSVHGLEFPNDQNVFLPNSGKNNQSAHNNGLGID